MTRAARRDAAEPAGSGFDLAMGVMEVEYRPVVIRSPGGASEPMRAVPCR